MEIQVNNRVLDIERQADGTLTVDGLPAEVDFSRISENSYQLVLNGKVHIIKTVNSDNGHVVLQIGGRTYEANAKSSLEKLLDSMGLKAGVSKQVKELKAPMPGLVLKVLSEPGTEVKKDDPLLILEAMKMENTLKSPSDGIVSKIAVQQGDKIEKNQILIIFE